MQHRPALVIVVACSAALTVAIRPAAAQTDGQSIRPAFDTNRAATASPLLPNQAAAVPSLPWDDPGQGRPAPLAPSSAQGSTDPSSGLGNQFADTPFLESAAGRAPAGSGMSNERSPQVGKTPIRRDESPTAQDANGSDSDKPNAADMLREGAWKSGVAVILLAAVGIATVILLKKRHPHLTGHLPREVCDILGRRRIDARTSVCLIRLGSRILVVGSTPDAVTPLAEIDDPTEIDHIAGLCQSSDGSRLPAFSNLLNQRIRPRATAKQTTPSQRTSATDRAPSSTRAVSPAAASSARRREPADLPALRDLKPGQKLDLTTPD